MPSEMSGLLGDNPSAHSTDSPTPRDYNSETVPLASSYEDLRQSVELNLKELNGASKARKDATIPSSKALNKQHAILILMLGCALVIVIVSVLNYNAVPAKPHSGSTSRGPKPFSTLDPVQDLYLPSFVRPEASGPPEDLFVNRSENKSQSNDHLGALPTNAWYQNLLVIRGEPSNVHRVYSTPYLLDLVGRIPGLRTHANHILSSTSVMQLTFNEDAGLTLGAAPDLSEKASSKELSHRYTILETTELGLTLQWVCLTNLAVMVLSTLICF